MKERAEFFITGIEIHRCKKEKEHEPIQKKDEEGSLLGKPHIHVGALLNVKDIFFLETKWLQDQRMDIKIKEVLFGLNPKKTKDFYALVKHMRYVFKEYRLEQKLDKDTGKSQGIFLLDFFINLPKFTLHYNQAFIDIDDLLLDILKTGLGG